MNERIRELDEQAYEQQPLMVANCETFEIEHKIGHGVAPMYHRVFNKEKFAELIVQECIDIIAPYSVRMIKPGEEYLHPISEIKKNFGVEE